MRFGRSRRGRRLAGWVVVGWGLLKIVHDILDFIIGKIGWLGVFTSPEDFKTMIERAPVWVASALHLVWDYAATAVELARASVFAILSINGLVGLFLVAVGLILLDLDVLRVRLSSLRFRMRSAVSEYVWISQDAAVRILRESEWGQLEAPSVEEERGFFDDYLPISMGKQRSTVSGLSKSEKAELKFTIYLRKLLKAFQKENAECVKDADGQTKFDEASIRILAEKLAEDKISDEFGSVPDVKIL